MSSVNRKHYFIECRDQRLYAIHFQGQHDKGAVVLCQPFGDEAIKARRVLFNLASAWAAEGADVLLVDYAGTGNSTGTFERVTLDTLLEDIGTSIDELRKMTDKNRITLAGLRFGATAAALAAEKVTEISNLILLEPVVVPIEYLRESLRANLATQMMIFGKVRYNREILEQRILQGKAVDVFGFPLTKEFFSSTSAVDLRNDVSIFKGKVSIIPISSLKSARVGKDITELSEKYERIGATCDILPARERPFWNELKEHYVAAEQVFNHVRLIP